MNDTKFNQIKQKALDEHIPIIMDDTLGVLEEKLKNCKIEKILEIGTAVRIFCNMFFKIIDRKWLYRNNRKR